MNEKLEQIRTYMKKYKMDAYIVPSDDFHSSEYVGDYFKVRQYLSGFTGSAGTLVILLESAALWTDGRYFLQAEEQLFGSGIDLMRSGETGVLKISEYLAEVLPENSVIGFDGRTVTAQFVQELKKKVDKKHICFRTDIDIVDKIWENRPELSKEPVWELPVAYAGQSRKEKIEKIRTMMKEKKADVHIVSSLDDIAWTLNLRGNDVAYTPVFLAYMILTQEEIVLCLQEEILSEAIRSCLIEDGILLDAYDQIDVHIQQIEEDKVVWMDKMRVNYQLQSCLKKEIAVVDSPSPIEFLKSIKTPQEIANIKKAHLKDGVAVTRFLYWLKTHIGKEEITELSAIKKLNQFRMEMDGFLGQSFEPIIAYGKHGAIVHYSATEKSNEVMEPSGFCLTDTGGHYIEGTTDVTRTIALGPLTEEEKQMYTTVLRGNLNLGNAVFKYGLSGQNLDYLAREPLWQRKMDYNHGTGHGVGYLLSVHEGPQRIHWRILESSKNIPLEAGMVVSNEPGVYIAGKFGIRHENLVLVCEGEQNDYGKFMHFDTLTLVPFDRDAIDCSLMREEEIKCLNRYHKRVYEELSAFLTEEEKVWLKEITKEL